MVGVGGNGRSGAAPTNGPLSVSLQQLYRDECKRAGCKCNTGVLRSLPDAVGDASTLKVIDLRANIVGHSGIVPVLRVAQHAHGLESLIVPDNYLDNDNMAELTKALDGHPTLSHLDLTGNPISHAGGKAIAAFVRRNLTLRSVVLTGTLINAALIQSIEKECLSRLPGAAQAPHATDTERGSGRTTPPESAASPTSTADANPSVANVNVDDHQASSAERGGDAPIPPNPDGSVDRKSVREDALAILRRSIQRAADSKPSGDWPLTHLRCLLTFDAECGVLRHALGHRPVHQLPQETHNTTPLVGAEETLDGQQPTAPRGVRPLERKLSLTFPGDDPAPRHRAPALRILRQARDAHRCPNLNLALRVAGLEHAHPQYRALMYLLPRTRPDDPQSPLHGRIALRALMLSAGLRCPRPKLGSWARTPSSRSPTPPVLRTVPTPTDDQVERLPHLRLLIGPATRLESAVGVRALLCSAFAQPVGSLPRMRFLKDEQRRWQRERGWENTQGIAVLVASAFHEPLEKVCSSPSERQRSFAGAQATPTSLSLAPVAVKPTPDGSSRHKYAPLYALCSVLPTNGSSSEGPHYKALRMVFSAVGGTSEAPTSAPPVPVPKPRTPMDASSLHTGSSNDGFRVVDVGRKTSTPRGRLSEDAIQSAGPSEVLVASPSLDESNRSTASRDSDSLRAKTPWMALLLVIEAAEESSSARFEALGALKSAARSFRLRDK